MPVFNSLQMAKLLATPVEHIRSDEHGRVRRATFAWESTSTPAAADTINLCKLPPGARVQDGKMFWEANTATATFKVGTAADDDKYSGPNAPLLTSASVAAPAAGGAAGMDLSGAAGGGTIAAPVVGEVLSAPVTIIGTVGVATLAASKRIYGWIDYLGHE